jgi:hypothetical protein
MERGGEEMGAALTWNSDCNGLPKHYSSALISALPHEPACLPHAFPPRTRGESVGQAGAGTIPAYAGTSVLLQDKESSMGIREEMPLLVRHEGEWVGTYTITDAEGNILDRHQSHLICSFPHEGEYPYVQTNIYTWPDGRREELSFPATYHDGKIWFDTERIKGFAWEVDPITIILTWTYSFDPAKALYETIQISPDGNHRARNWQWFEHGELVKRTLIKEKRLK